MAGMDSDLRDRSLPELLKQLSQETSTLVKQELDLLSDDDDEARIYKLIGPVLVKQEKKEAASNVGKRIDFLQGELKKLEANLEDMQKKQAAKRRFIVEMQTKLQMQQQQPPLSPPLPETSPSICSKPLHKQGRTAEAVVV